jgi:uncharacterized protein
MDQQSKTTHKTESPPLSASPILLSGASGMLGQALARTLTAEGYGLIRLTRDRKSRTEPGTLLWNPDSGAWDARELEELRPSAAIHLSGANVAARRWTKAYKQEIVESRVKTTRVLAEGLAKLPNPPKVLVTASATGIYGDRGDEILSDDSPAGQGFFPELCTAWEAATRPASEAGIRVVHLRFGAVIGPDGGMIAKLLPVFRLGLGGPLGNGRQWVNWVSETDAANAAIFAVEHDSLSGPLNVVAPHPVTNAEFTRTFAHAVHRPAILPAPAFALRAVFGQMADEALLASTRAIPKRLPESGFRFTYPTLAEALDVAVERHSID